MNETVWFTTRRSLRTLCLFGAAFFSMAFCFCFATIPFNEARFIAPWFMAFVMIIGWMYRATRFCSDCDRVLNRRWFERPAWCWCGSLVEPAQVIDSPGKIDLAAPDWPEHPQPVTKIIHLLSAIMIRERANRMTIREDGSVQFEIGRRLIEFEPMPAHLVIPTAKVLSTVAQHDGSRDRAEFVFCVPIADRKPITLPAEVCFRSTPAGKEIAIHAETVPPSIEVAIGSRDKE